MHAANMAPLLNGVFWTCLPKPVSFGLETLQLRVDEAVAGFSGRLWLW